MTRILLLLATLSLLATTPFGPGIAAPSDPADPQIRRTVTNALRAEGLSAQGAEHLTQAEALEILNTLFGGDDIPRAPVVARIRQILDTAARR